MTASNQMLTSPRVRLFRQAVYDNYLQNGRKLPWRETSDPYHILVSEIMLQQTQVERVLTKYDDFLGRFPDFQSLAASALREVLAVWQGLGYNRRAMSLQRTAQRVVNEFGGILPDSVGVLRTFPGIGPATAGALVAFAFHQPAVFIETNIRRVFIHFYFPKNPRVTDKEILPLVEQTLDVERVRDWYYALMDYGVMLRSLNPNPNRRSAHYGKQAPFSDSDRQIRGLILKILVTTPVLSEEHLIKAVGKDEHRTKAIISKLVQERFLERERGRVRIVANSVEAERP